jgi:hypothetical protein
MEAGVLVRAVWAAWLAACALLASRSTPARFYSVVAMAGVLLLLIVVSAIWTAVAWKRRRWRDFVVPGASFVLLVVGFLASLMWGSTPPTHEELDMRFRSHREAFEKLMTMLETDRLGTVRHYGIGDAYAFVRADYHMYAAKDVHLSEERSREYRQIMWDIDCERIDRDGRKDGHRA